MDSIIHYHDNVCYLLVRGSRDTDRQAARPDGRDHFAGRVSDQDNPEAIINCTTQMLSSIKLRWIEDIANNKCSDTFSRNYDRPTDGQDYGRYTSITLLMKTKYFLGNFNPFIYLNQ